MGIEKARMAEISAKLTAMRLDSSPDGHIGLENVNTRIKYFYGEEYGLSFEDAPGGGALCHMYIGLEKARAD